MAERYGESYAPPARSCYDAPPRGDYQPVMSTAEILARKRSDAHVIPSHVPSCTPEAAMPHPAPTKQIIDNYLAEHDEVTAQQVAESSGVKRSIIASALARMCDKGEVVRTGEGVYARPAEPEPATDPVAEEAAASVALDAGGDVRTATPSQMERNHTGKLGSGPWCDSVGNVHDDADMPPGAFLPVPDLTAVIARHCPPTREEALRSLVYLRQYLETASAVPVEPPKLLEKKRETVNKLIGLVTPDIGNLLAGLLHDAECLDELARKQVAA